MANPDISRRSDDEILIRHCLTGDESAFGFLIHKYKELVYAYACQKVLNYSDAEDIAQEVFIRVYRNLGKLRYPHNFRSWLYTIASNECKRHLARKSRRQEREISLDNAPEEALGSEADFHQTPEDWQIDLEEAMKNLPEGNRIAVFMFYMSDCSLKEISEYLGVSINTVKSKLFRARQQLGNMLGHYKRALSENRLKGGFVMQTMEQIRNLPRPIIRSPWREQMVRQIPLTIASTLCMLLGVLGMLSYSQEQFQIIPEYTSPTAINTVNYRTEPVKLLQPTYTGDLVVLPVEYMVADASSQSPPGLAGSMSHNLYSAQTAAGIRNQETSISGKVTSKVDGKPIAGAKAWLDRLGRGTETDTDSDGKYSIIVERSGENRLWVAADGFATSLTVITIPHGMQLKDVNIELIAGADASGRVVDEEGNPIEGVEVWTAVTNASMEPVETDDQGRYTFKGLEPFRKYTMQAGFKRQADHPIYRNGWVEISVDKPGEIKAPDIVLRARKGITISGRVVNESGEPIAGAEVIAGKAPYMSNSVQAQTDDAGRYAVRNVSEGDSFVIVKAEGYAPDLLKVQVMPDEDMQRDFTMKPGKSIAGKISDEDGNPIKDVHIAVGTWYGNRAIYNTTTWAQTDADGSFRVDNLLEIKGMELRASVMKDGYSRIDDVAITPGKTDLEFVMKTSGKIAGRVVDTQTSEPITSFIVKLNIPQFKPGENVPRHGIASTWTRRGHRFVSPKGEFLAFDFIQGSIYKLTVIAEGYTPATIERVTSSAKPKANDLMIRLEKERIIKGTVTDTVTGNPVGNATIWHFNSVYPMIVSPWSNVTKGGTKSVRNGVDGLFSIAGSSEGNFLYVNHPQYAPAIVGPFDIEDTEELPSVMVKLSQGGRITGYVKSGTEPVSRERMELSLIGGVTNLEVSEPIRALRDGSAFAFTEKTQTASDGYFEFVHVMPGKYRLTQMMEGEGFASGVRMTEIQVSEGETISLNFGGSGGAILRGRITDGEGAPIKNAAVYLRVDGDPLGSGGVDHTDSDGRYEIRDLPPGIHGLRAMKHEPLAYRAGGPIPSPMRFSGSIEVTEESKEIEYDIKLTSRSVVSPESTTSRSPADADSSGKMLTLPKVLTLPEDTTERFPTNGDFEEGLAGWTKWQGKDKGSIQTCEIVHDEERNSNVVEFRRTNGGREGSSVGIAQDVYIDLSEYDELYLQIDMKPIYHSLSGGGWAGGGEYPVIIDLEYIDEKRTGHRWRHGVYYRDESRYS